MKRSSGFANAAADKIWNDHLGNNAFVDHRKQCEQCATTLTLCLDGDRILSAVLDEVMMRVDEAIQNQN